MAEEAEEKWADFNPLITGSAGRAPDTPPPPRGWSGAVMDTGIDLAKSVVGVGKQIHGVREAIATGIAPGGEASKQALGDVDALSDLQTVLEGYKTPRGQQLTREPESFGESPGKWAVNTAVNMAPYIPLAIATGGWGGAAAFGTLGFGQVRTDLRENLRNSSDEQLRKNPIYADLMDQGLSRDEAIDKIYNDATDPRKLQTYLDAAPNVAGQIATGGVGGSVLKGVTRAFGKGAGEVATHGATRRVTSDIVQKVIDKANANWATRRATGATIGAGAGAMAGGGQEASRQLSEMSAGIQTEPFDWGKTAEAAGDQAALFSAMGTVGYRGPAKPKVPSIDTHVEAAAKDMTDDKGRVMPEGPKVTPATGGFETMTGGDLGMGPEYGPHPPMGPFEHYGPTRAPTPAEVETHRRGEEEAGLGRMAAEGYGAPASRRPFYGEAPPAPDARLPRPGGDRTTGMVKAGDLGVADPNFAPGEFGQQTEPGTARPPRGQQRARPMAPGEVGYHMEDAEPGRAPDVTPGRPMEHGDIYRGMAPPEGSAPAPFGEETPVGKAKVERGETGTGVPVDVEPPPAKPEPLPPAPEKPKNISDGATYIGRAADGRTLWMKDGKREFADPITGARHTEPEKNSGIHDFQAEHETPTEHWVRPDTVKKDLTDLAALMSKESANTRGQWADRLQRQLKASKSAGRYAPVSIRLFPELGQKRFGALRGKMDALLHHDPQGTIDTIRGDVEQVKGRPGIDEKDIPAVRQFAENAGPEKAKAWGDKIAEIATRDNHLATWIRLPKEFRDFLQEPGNKRLETEVKRALRTNPLEFADTIRGQEHVPGHIEYAYPKDVGKARREAAAERKGTDAEEAAREAEERALQEETRTEGEAAVGMLEAAEPPPERPPAPKEKPKASGGTLSLKPKAEAPKEAPATFAEKLQHAIDVAKRKEKDKSAATTTLVGTQRAYFGDRYAGRHPGGMEHTKPVVATVVKTKLGVGPAGERVMSTAAKRAEESRQQERFNKDKANREALVLEERVEGHMVEREQEEFEIRVAQRAAIRKYIELLRRERAASEKGLSKGDVIELKKLRRAEEKERTSERSNPQHPDHAAHLAALDTLAAEATEIRRRAAEEGMSKEGIRKAKDAARQEARKAPEFEDRDQKSENILKIDDPKLRKAETDKLNKIVTGMAETKSGERLIPDFSPEERAAAEKEGMILVPRNLMTASADELKAIGKALAERGMAKVKKAELEFQARSAKQKREHGRFWAIGEKVGTSRGPHGVYYNHLVGYRKFNASMQRFSGNKTLLHTFIVNHYVAERLVMEGKHSKLEKFYREQYNFVDDLMKQRYDAAVREGTPGEIAERMQEWKDFHELADVSHEGRLREGEFTTDVSNEQIDAAHDLWARTEELGVKAGPLNEWAHAKLQEFVDRLNKENAETRRVEARREEARKAAGEPKITPFHEHMVALHGEEWRHASNERRTDILTEAEYNKLYGGDAIRERRPVDPEFPDALRLHPREGMRADDIAQSARDLNAIMQTEDRFTGPADKEGQRIRRSPEAERAARITFLTERATKLQDAIETMPERIWGSLKETAVRWREALGEKPMESPTLAKLEKEIKQASDEMDFITEELREHYEAANPKARNSEYGLKQVLNNSADLSNHANLPRGAYLRRVSDFLKPGARDIREGVKGFGNKLRQHLLKIADKAVGDMEVVALTGEQMNLAAVERDLPGDTPAFYDRQTHRILISQGALRSPDRAKIIGHEITHPLTIRAMEMFPEIRKRFEGMLEEVREAYAQPRHPAHGVVRNLLEGDPQVLRDVHEFIAQLYNDGSNLAQALHAIETPPNLRAKWKTDALWDGYSVMRETIKHGLNNLLWSMSKKRLLNDATLNSLDLLHRMDEAGPYTRPSRKGKAQPYTPPTGTPPTHGVIPVDADGAMGWAKERLKDAAFRMERMGLGGALLKARSFHEMGRLAEEGMQRVVKAVEDIWSQVESTAKSLYKASGAEDIARTIAAEMNMAPGHFKAWGDYIADEGQMRVTGSDPLYEGRNKWVSPDSPYHKQFRDNYVEMKRKWDALTPSQQEAHRRMLDYYDKTHREILSTNIKRLIGMKEMVPGRDPATTEALLKHILKEDLTEHEKTLLNDNVAGYASEIDETIKSPEQVKFRNDVGQIRSNPAFRKVDGAWHPGIRRGDWVVAGRYKLDHIAARFGGVKIGDRGALFEFPSEDAARGYYEAVIGTEGLKGLHHEGTTKVVYKTDEAGHIMRDAEGNPVFETAYSERTSRKGEPGEVGYTETTKGALRRITAKEAEGAEGTVTRHRVEFNNLLLEFYENQRHAFERDAALRSGDPNLELSLPLPKRDPQGTYLDPQHASASYDAMITSLHRSKAWENMDTTTRKMTERDLREAAVTHLMSASARSNLLPKRYAIGANKEVLRNFNEYARRSSMTIAELHHRTDLSDAVANMDKYVKDNERMGSPNDPQGKFGVLRDQLRREVHDRLFTRQSDIVAPFWSKALARVLQVSYLDKLMSPGFVVLNASEPWVLGLPLLSGHHGYFNSFGHLGKAYAALGFHGMWGKGVADAIRAAREGTAARFEDNHALLKDRVKNEKDGAALQQLFDYLEKRGYLDRDAGMELATRTDPSTSPGGKALDYLDNISRQVNAQIENVNRGVTGIAAYRMAIEKGMTPEAAMVHAADMIHDVSGNYGHWNNPAIFNNPHLKFALQFKRYAQRITSMYVRMFAQAFSRLPSDQRAIARKQLGIMLGSQILLSGGLGLPTEPIKLALLATSPLTGFGPDEAEIWAREATASLTGNAQFAEGLMRGFPRAYLDIGIGTRMGHDSLWSQGTIGKKPADWYSTFGHTLAGAPGGMFVDWANAAGKAVDAVGHFARGNNTEARANAGEFMQLAMPMKLASDVYGAAQNYYGGPKTRTPAGQPLGYQPTVGQALLEASGIRSGTSQEASDKRFALSHAKAQYATEKNSALQMYSRASTPAEKRSIEEAAIRNSKERWPKEMWLTHSDFYKAQRRYDLRGSASPEDVGVLISKRQAGLRDRFSFYNN